MRTRIYATGPDLTGPALKGLADRSRNAKPAMEAVLGHLLKAEREQFATEGARGGKPWKKDTRKWREQKAAQKKGISTKTERYTDALYHSLTEKEDSKGIRIATKQTATLGTRIFYAAFQGAKRQLLWFNRTDTDVEENIIVSWLLDGKVIHE